jgi:hypothetical protein
MIRKVDHEPGEGETEYFTSVSIEGRLSREEEEAYRVLAQKMGCENMTSDGWLHVYQFPYMHAGADVFVGKAEADLVRRMGVNPDTVLVEIKDEGQKETVRQGKESGEEEAKDKAVEKREMKEEETKKDESIEKALLEEHGIDPSTKEGKSVMARLLEGEKVTVRSEDGNLSYDIALAEGRGLLSGNLTVTDKEKLSEGERETAGKLEGRRLAHYMDGRERVGWAVVTEDNIPDQIKGHSVTTQEKQAMLRGESIVIDGCTEGAKEPYSAEVHMNLEKRGERIKPVMSVKPKKNEPQSQKQKQKAGQSQRQGMRQ